MGTGGAAPFLETTDEEFQKMQSATLGGVFYGCRSAIRSMLESGGHGTSAWRPGLEHQGITALGLLGVILWGVI